MSTNSLQLCPTLCAPIDCSLPGSSLRGILQAKILGWAAMPSSRNLPNSGTKLESLVSSALAGRFFTTRANWEVHSQLTRDCELPEDDGGAPTEPG